MPLTIDPARAAFTLSGPDCEPVNSAAWQSATAATRKRYYARLGELAAAALDRQIARGLGRDGRKLARVKPRQGKYRGAQGPPLTPFVGQSRTRRLIASSATASGARVYWRASGRESWGMILLHHARGEVIGAPVRDVIGLTKAGERWAIDRARLWWRNQHPFDRPAPAPAPVQVTRPVRQPQRVAEPPPIAAAGFTTVRPFALDRMDDTARRFEAGGWVTEWGQRRAPTQLPPPKPPRPPQPPRGGSPAPVLPLQPRPAPLPLPAAARPAAVAVRPGTVAAVERDTGLKLGLSARARTLGYRLTVVDVRRMDASLATDRDTYVGPGGTGGIQDDDGPRYEKARAFLEHARRRGIRVEVPQVELGDDGEAFIRDGRHRWAVLRDEGYPYQVVAVLKEEVQKILERFGVVSPRRRIQLDRPLQPRPRP